MIREDLFKTHYLGSLSLSPLKDKLAYVDIMGDKDNDKYNANIYLRDLKTEKTIKLTTGNKERSIKWLDNETIVFTSNRDEKAAKSNEPCTIFYKMPTTGGEAREYFRTSIAIGDFYFLENGKIAATCSIDRNNPFFKLDEEGKKNYQKTMELKSEYETFTDAPFWANGAGIIDGNRSIVAIINPEDGSVEPLTCLDDNSSICDVKGNKILFTSHKEKGIREIENGLFEYDGTIKTIVEDGVGHVTLANYVGEKIVYCYATFETWGYHQHGDLYIYSDGKVLCQVAHDNTFGGYVGSDALQQFSDGIVAVGDYLYFLEVDADVATIRRLDTNSGTIEVLYKDEIEITDLAVTDDCFYFIGNNSSSLSEIYKLENGKCEQLTFCHKELLENTKLGEVSRLDFENDGVSLKGFVIKPVDYDPNKKYPGLLVIHGGPKGTYGPGFMYGMQTFASQGYFVFYTNPRGSDSRGNKFADIRGRFGKEDYFDLMKFTDEVLAAYPSVDKDKLCVTGLSYGGYMTNWIITQTDRFAAAVAEASISNYVTKFLCTDIGFTYNIDNQAADPWSDIDLVWEQSPLKYANKVVTPTMFIHSDKDYRCWIAEGVQMYTALKMHNVETKFMLFHNEHHGMSLFGKPSHRIARLQAMMSWFDSHTGK